MMVCCGIGCGYDFGARSTAVINISWSLFDYVDWQPVDVLRPSVDDCC